MYCSYFGLRCRPFDDRPDPDFFCPTSKHEEVLAAMEYDARQGSGIAIVLGEAGTGKTLLVHALRRRLGKAQTVAVLTCPLGGGFNVVRAVARHFGIKQSSSSRSSHLVARIQRELQKRAGDHHPVVLLVDQAEQLDDGGMKELAALSELDGHQPSPLQIFLVGQPRLQALLGRHQLESFRQRALSIRTLASLTPAETTQYIQARLKVAGGCDAGLFDEQIIRLINEASGGNPRIINRICDAALLSAYGAGTRRITAAIIGEVSAGISAKRPSAAQVDEEQPIPQPRATTPVETPLESVEPLTVCEPLSAPGVVATYDYDAGASAGSLTSCDEANLPGGDSPDPDWDLRERTESLTRSIEGSIGRGVAHLRRQEAVSKSIEVLTAGGEALVKRMERAVRRTEQIHAARARWASTCDDGERRVDQKIKRGEQMLETLSEASKRVEETVRQADSRAESIARQYEDRIAALGERLAASAMESEQAAGRLEQMSQVLERARAAEERLTGFGERLLESGENAQEKISVLMKGLTSGEKVLERLEITTREANEVADGCGKAVERHSKAAQEIFQRCDGLSARLSAETESAVRRAEEIEQRFAEDTARQEVLRADHERLTGQVDGLAAKADALPKLIAQADARADELTNRCNAAVESYTQAVDRTSERCEQSTAKLSTAVDDAMKTSAEAEQRLENLTERQTSAVAQLERSVESMDGMHNRVRTLAQAAAAVESKVEELELCAAQSTAQLDDRLASAEWKVADLHTRAQAAVTDMASSVERGEGYVAQVREAIGQAESVHHTVANCLISIGSACERVDAAKQEITALKDSLGEISQARSQCDKMSERFNAMLKEAEGLGAILNRVEEAKGFGSQVKTLVDELTGARDLAGAAQAALSERVTEAQDHGEGICRRLEAATVEASEGLRRTEELAPTIEEATQVHEMVTIDLNQANQKIEALGSHVAAASDVLRTLSDATHQGHDIVERATAACDKVERAENLAHRATSAAEYCDRLTDLMAAVRKDFEHFEALRGAAQVEGERAALRLEEESSAARKHSEQLMSTLQTQMEAARETAKEHEQAVRCLHESTSAAHQAGDRLKKLQAEAGGVERVIAEVVAQPEAVVADAKAQAVHLKEVCTVVRKVFAGLSRTSLEADQKTRQFEDASRDADERLRRLLTETDKACNTLREWVEEGIRAQTRLAESITHSPTIAETHPVENLQSMARSLTPVASDPRVGRSLLAPGGEEGFLLSTRSSGQITEPRVLARANIPADLGPREHSRSLKPAEKSKNHLRRPRQSSLPSPITAASASDRPTPHADEIAGLIDDAKRAAYKKAATPQTKPVTPVTDRRA